MGINKARLAKLPHYLSGAVILLHSFERFEKGHDSFLLFFFAGFVFLLLAIFHNRLPQRFRKADLAFYAIEGLLSFFIAWELHHEGKEGLPYAYVFAGLMQCIALVIFARKGRHGHSGERN